MAITCEAQCSDLALSLLKADLGYFDSQIPGAVESNLIDLLCVAHRNLLEECHITLISGDIYDAQLLAMYAAWLYRNKATGAGKTQALKDAIRNRHVRNSLRDDQVSAEVGL